MRASSPRPAVVALDPADGVAVRGGAAGPVVVDRAAANPR